MHDLKLVSIRPWAPHPKAAPRTERRRESLMVAANGTRTCVGGWQLTYSGVKPGRSYLIGCDADVRGVGRWRDTVRCMAYWGKMATECADVHARDIQSWDYVLPERTGLRTLQFSRRLTAPKGAGHLTVRLTLRWSTTGEVTWRLPSIESVARRRPDRPDLIVLPEIALQWGIGRSPIDLAVPAPGPETNVFTRMARRNGVRIVLGMLERDGDAVHNSAVLIGPEGRIDGRYRKVHLAVGGETESGILPGDGFPVLDTEVGRIGCTICMDSSAAESSRMVGLNGADFMVLPIMGDHRAWHPAEGGFDPDRFRAIMRTRAMDNQFCVIVARNNGDGSCIVDRVGNVLAWNEGDQDTILASVKLDDGYLTANHGCYRAVNWMQRRPHVYGEFVEDGNGGSLV